MKRIIEILKEIEINHKSLSMQYLVNKFDLTIRTIQKDIKIINNLLSQYGDYKINFKKNKLNIVKSEKIEKVINKILLDLTDLTNDCSLIKIYELILFFIYKENYTSYENLLAFFKIDKYSLKQNIDLINNSFYYYSLNLRLVYKQKIGWLLKGNEIDLRLVATNILSNQDIGPHYLKKNNLFYLFNKLEEMLLKWNFDRRYLITELIWFLVIVIKRVKTNNGLKQNYLKFNELPYEESINNDLKELENLLINIFDLNLNNYEISYLKYLLFLNRKNFNLKISKTINKTVTNLILKKYQLPVNKSILQQNLLYFLQQKFLKIYFNFYSVVNFELMVFPFPLINQNLYGWEFINIVNSVLKKFNIGIKTNLLLNTNLFKVFNILFQENKINCKIPLYYSQTDLNKLNGINKQLILFIVNQYQNVHTSPLNLKKLYYQLNLINKSYAIIIHQNPNIEWSQYQNIYQIEYNSFKVNNNKLELYINKFINTIRLKQIVSKIFIFDLFLKQNFFNLKNLLLVLQEAVVKKFKLNTLTFQLENCLFDYKYLKSKILLIKKILPINNIEIPIILTYIKKPLIFHEKYQINYIFIQIVNSNTLHQDYWLSSFLEKFEKLTIIKVENVKKLYTIINDSLTV